MKNAILNSQLSFLAFQLWNSHYKQLPTGLEMVEKPDKLKPVSVHNASIFEDAFKTLKAPAHAQLDNLVDGILNANEEIQAIDDFNKQVHQNKHPSPDPFVSGFFKDVWNNFSHIYDTFKDEALYVLNTFVALVGSFMSMIPILGCIVGLIASCFCSSGNCFKTFFRVIVKLLILPINFIARYLYYFEVLKPKKREIDLEKGEGIPMGSYDNPVLHHFGYDQDGSTA